MGVREPSGIQWDVGVGVGKLTRGPRVITCGLYYSECMYVSIVHESKC